MDGPGTPAPSASVAAASLKGDTTVEEPDRAGRAIARRSAEIRATVPDLELSVEAEADALLARVEAEGCTTTALLIAACAGALRAFPRVNGAYRDGRYELYSRVNVGVVTQIPEGPVTATVLDADVKSVAQLDQEVARLAARARSGELTPPEQAGATFTVDDLGEYGVHRAAGLVRPSQAAILTAGAIRALPVLRDGVVVAGHQLTLTLTCDHRILFGDQAAGFLRRVMELVQG
ncbi:MAG TPA: 2-oxo acid dehydrogenase subunit E2 [Solirubrobacteraceae bacterium]|nr:2-oxo acid dehydrogenase subunit E2 [Solirubrobacteraceae bacterium]